MTFDELLDKLWGYDMEIFAHDSLLVVINYRTRERVFFHNTSANEIQEWIDKTHPILMGYNCNNYDKWILKGWLYGMNPEELKNVNDYIVNGGNGWDIDMGYVRVPTNWDLMGCIKTFKSLKELEANLRLPITETTVPFDLPTKWTEQQFQEVLYYCTKDVEALFPIFNKLINKYKAKYIVCKIGKIDYETGLSMTDANLTAKLLGAEKKNHDDPFGYTYPDCINKSKIPDNVLEYIDDLIAHNDLNYKRQAPSVIYDKMEIQLGVGGTHGFRTDGNVIYDRGDVFECD